MTTPDHDLPTEPNPVNESITQIILSTKLVAQPSSHETDDPDESTNSHETDPDSTRPLDRTQLKPNDPNFEMITQTSTKRMDDALLAQSAPDEWTGKLTLEVSHPTKENFLLISDGPRIEVLGKQAVQPNAPSL